MRTRPRPRLLAGIALSASAAIPLLSAPAGAAPALRATPAVDAAAAWLAAQQEADGGFELANFAGFETPDAILALAAAGQPGPGWDEDAALGAVTAVQTDGKDPLDSVDDWVDSVQGDDAAGAPARAQQAAKVIALVTVPLGLDATDFDPSDDTAGPVDLVAALRAGAGPDSDYAGLPFGGRVFAVWALGALGSTAPDPLLASIASSQQANGGFSFTGDADGTGFDPDLTASVVISLRLGGTAAQAGVVGRTIVGLGLQQVWDGQWATEFDDGNPNSTAMVMLAAATLGGDPDDPCWRDAPSTLSIGVPYPSPRRSIQRRQAGDGHIASPNDGVGLTTFATSQSIQALVAAGGSWPYAGAECTAPSRGPSRRLVNAHYADLLRRLSDEVGASFWVDQLDSGALTPAQVARRITVTTEYDRSVVDGLYRRYLGRPASADERTLFQAIVRSGRRGDVAAAILGSGAFSPDAPDTVWVEDAYLAILDRSPDPVGRQWALDQLRSGRSRTQVARTLLGSTEALRVLVTDTYHDLLRRDPDRAGRDFWVGEIRRGQSPERLVLLIAGSSEYVAKTAAPA